MRKTISKKQRFEVFKRDSFKCQYCGKSAPDVVLEVDHINPVASGGTNEIFNLITSCFDCNRGKGHKKLDDTTEVSKQKDELDKLNEVRVQLEMLSEWRSELSNLEDKKVQILNDVWKRDVGEHLDKSQSLVLKRLLKRFDLPLLIDSMNDSITQYLEFNQDSPTTESKDKVFEFIERIAKRKKQFEKDPYLKDLYYIKGILRNRLRYFDERKATILLSNAFKANCDADSLKELAKKATTWTQFRSSIESFLDGGDLLELFKGDK